jgi:hypothetical protein
LAASAALAANVPAAAAANNHYYELRTYQLRNDLRPARINEFFQHHYLPMMKRIGVGPVGCFNVISGLPSPSLIVFIDYKSLAEMQSSIERQSSDREFARAAEAFEAAELPYVRYESALLRAFDSHPQTEVPATNAERAARVFELRTYESKNSFSLANKIAMFNQEEIKIFREAGFAPVFFGEGVMGTRLPHLTYLVGFDDLASRDRAWGNFLRSPDWARIRNKPGWTDAEAVSNIHASFLRPTAFSQIR